MLPKKPYHDPAAPKFQVGIDLGDNDYNNTVRPFLELFLQNCAGWRMTPTKEQVVRLFNLSAPGLYWLCQNRLEYSDTEDQRAFMNNYLQIGPERVWIGDEVVKRYNEMMATGNYNASFFFSLDPLSVSRSSQ